MCAHITLFCIENNRQRAFDAAIYVNRSMLSTINDDVARIHRNEQDLEREAQSLHKATAAFVTQTSQWMKMYGDLNKAVAGLGDVEKWAKQIETDMRTISSALEYVHGVETKGQ